MAVSKKPTKSKATTAESVSLRRLKSENDKLRALLDVVWELLVAADNVSSSGELREAIDRACDEMNTVFPDTFPVEEDSLSTEAEKAAQQESALSNDAAGPLADLNKEIAIVLGITEEEAMRADVNVRLPALREAMAKRRGIAWSELELSDEEYEHLVRVNFGTAVLLAARIPCTLRGEAERFINTLRALQSGYPKRVKKPAPAVSNALRMIEQGEVWKSVYEKVLGPDAPKELKERLRHTVNVHRSNESKLRKDPEKNN